MTQTQELLDTACEYLDAQEHADSPLEIISVGALAKNQQKIVSVLCVRTDVENRELMQPLMQALVTAVAEAYKEFMDDPDNL